MRTIVNITLLILAIWLYIAWSPTGHADDGANAVVHDAALFCRWLDGDSTPQGVMRAVNEFEIQGVPYDNVVGTMAYALTYICPEYVAAARYADVYYNGPKVGV
jgi:hypothetical protein